MPEAGRQGRSRLIAALLRHAEQRPDGIAFCESPGGRCLTWRQLKDCAGGLARRLLEHHERPTVVVLAANTLELPVALLGALWAGGEVAPLAPDLPVSQLREVIQKTHASAVVGDQRVLAAASSMGCIDPIPLGRILEDAARGTATAPPGGHRGALLLLTSGTSGAAKLVRRGAHTLDAVGQACFRSIGVIDSDRMLLTIPLHHSYGIDQGLLTAIFAGCRVELHDGFALPRVRAALQEGVTILPAVPFLFDVLVRAGGTATWPRTALRRAISAGGPLPRAVFDEFLAASGIAIGQIYGATEFGAITWSDPLHPSFAPQSAGRPFPGVEIRILNPEDPDPDRPLPATVEGRVAVAAPSLFDSYVGEGAIDTPGGFFPTSDLGRFDAAGNLELTGRTSLLVDVGGRKVNPIEIECVLESHPAVAAAAVVPVPYSRTVTRLKAIIVPSTPREPTPEELRRYLEGQVAAYKIPRSFEMRASLPRSPTGKLLRQQLHDVVREDPTDSDSRRRSAEPR